MGWLGRKEVDGLYPPKTQDQKTRKKERDQRPRDRPKRNEKTRKVVVASRGGARRGEAVGIWLACLPAGRCAPWSLVTGHWSREMGDGRQEGGDGRQETGDRRGSR